MKFSAHVRLLREQLDYRDQLIHKLHRKLRTAGELQRRLDRRNEQLAETEEKVAALMQDVAERNYRLARSERHIRRLNDQLEQLRNTN